ncbi:hypothetical protein NQ314_002129 [Rhamnusium bicolor]|uniref:Monocarboxylate transporter 9 n=1 Tax=Rhamnusium bicolor TaxID=1586634 RepID=A0AAV8ZTS8_9CUCU|nr:hypothetical protein NQ314_002129 [Rhamnusium bicolor]
MVNMDLKSNEKVTITINDKPKRRRLRVGDPDFVPPDGGWGWLIVFACGFSNLSTFPMFQQFGLVFRGKFEELEISETKTTTVINLNSAFNAGMGLINGPLFRKFSYRKVAMFGSCLVASSLLLCTFCESFWAYLIFYAMCYGSGIGITQSSNALALNTYFKEKRRIATGFSWTTTALGPIVWPYIIVALNELYGMEGTLLLFSGFALHAFVCSLLLQPVEWHTKFKSNVPESVQLLEKPETQNPTNNVGKLSRKGSRSIFSSQYLRNEDDPIHTGYEITDPGTPMMIKSNDGWYSQSRSQLGSRVSLSSNKAFKQSSGQNSLGVSKRPSYSNLVDHGRESRKRERKVSQSKPIIKEEVEDPGNDIKKEEIKPLKGTEEYPNEKEEFNFGKYETATFMSLLGATDIVVRFFIPFIADRVGWSNKTFFLLGVMSMALGRIILVHTQTYSMGLFVAVIIGAGKALRTIFMALVIPSYVPLERLPAASGLQLATSGLLFIILGPVVGWVREAVQNYVITLHILNICTYATAVAWTIERFLTRKKSNSDEKATKT